MLYILHYVCFIICRLVQRLEFASGPNYNRKGIMPRAPALAFLRSKMCKQTGEGIMKRGEVWRLATCCFMHGSPMHLIVNMQSLYNLGAGLESFSGKARFLCVYAAGGICSSLTSLFLTPNPSVGASGNLSPFCPHPVKRRVVFRLQQLCPPHYFAQCLASMPARGSPSKLLMLLRSRL